MRLLLAALLAVSCRCCASEVVEYYYEDEAPGPGPQDALYYEEVTTPQTQAPRQLALGAQDLDWALLQLPPLLRRPFGDFLRTRYHLNQDDMDASEPTVKL